MKCIKCGKAMNPVQSLLSATHKVCGSCARKNHKKLSEPAKHIGKKAMY